MHFVRMGLRRAVSLAAIYVVALHTILLGIVPVPASASVVGDPFSIICHSDAAGGSACRTGPRQARYHPRPRLRPLHSLQRLGAASTQLPYSQVSSRRTRLLQVLQPGSTCGTQPPCNHAASRPRSSDISPDMRSPTGAHSIHVLSEFGVTHVYTRSMRGPLWGCGRARNRFQAHEPTRLSATGSFRRR